MCAIRLIGKRPGRVLERARIGIGPFGKRARAESQRSNDPDRPGQNQNRSVNKSPPDHVDGGPVKDEEVCVIGLCDLGGCVVFERRNAHLGCERARSHCHS